MLIKLLYFEKIEFFIFFFFFLIFLLMIFLNKINDMILNLFNILYHSIFIKLIYMTIK